MPASRLPSGPSSSTTGSARHASAEPLGLWASFVLLNKRVCKSFFLPRLYTVSHMSAVEWWVGVRVQSLARRERLLEFGCGTTFPISRLVGSQFAHCEATDVVDVPRDQWPDGVSFTQCTLTGLPFEANRFDAIVIRSVMEHVEDPQLVYKELARVLKPGGAVFMNLPNKWDYVSVLARLTGGLKTLALQNIVRPGWDDFPVHYRTNTRRALKRALRGSGLTVEHFRPLPSEPAYLSFFVPLYLLGALYQFAISFFALDFLQPAFLVVLRRGDA